MPLHPAAGGFIPRQAAGGTLVYLHGGGWGVGDVETHDPLCRRVANAASLAAGLAIRARDTHIPLAAQLLLYPATDPAMTSRSLTENGEGYFLTRHDMAWFYQQYLPAGAAGAGSAEADLAHAEVAGVAPAIVATAEFDPLRDEGAAYAARLEAAGVPVEYVPGPGLIHGFAAFLGVVDAADATAGTALKLLSQALHASG